MVRLVLKWGALVLGAVVLIGAGFLGLQWRKFSADSGRIWEVPPPRIRASSDSAVIARGRHIAESYGGCIGCHGDDLGGRLVEEIGPIGVIRAANITTGEGGLGPEYSDELLARAIRHGVRPDGTSLRYMPTVEHHWWPDEDLEAVVSWVRSMPAVDRTVEPSVVRPLGKVLYGVGLMPMVVSAATVDHDAPREAVPEPAPTAAYGAFLARSCFACHGDGLSGGAIPGAPADLAVPSNLTPHESGLAGWSYEDFARAMETRTRPDGTRIDDFMPVGAVVAMNETERRALWAFLEGLEPAEFGGR